ncbi:MAG: hypothetical protein O2912_06650 [Proteobacteria bacterium]|nr:hypothetical protein [Pseudomonadota bacterium]
MTAADRAMKETALQAAQEYWAFLVIFLLGLGFGYHVSIQVRCTEIAMELWPEHGRDCLVFMVPAMGGPIKFGSAIIAAGLTLNDSHTRGPESYLLGIAAFAMSFAWMHARYGNPDKTERILPGIHARLKLRRGQLKSFGQPGKSEIVEDFIARLEQHYPYLAVKTTPRMRGPFGG